MKKIIIMCIVLAILIAVVAAAVLLDRPSDMTAGELRIRQYLYQRIYDEHGRVTLSEELDAHDMSPAYFDADAIENGNRDTLTWSEDTELEFWSNDSVTGAVDRIVAVNNRSLLSSAYVRTVFAFEADYDAVVCNVNTDDWTWSCIAEDVKIANGTNDGIYDIYTAVYIGGDEQSGKLGAGDTTPPSLLQIALKPLDDDIKAIIGSNYNVLVHSQACQTMGMGDDAAAALDAVFGDLKEKDSAYFSELEWETH